VGGGQRGRKPKSWLTVEKKQGVMTIQRGSRRTNAAGAFEKELNRGNLTKFRKKLDPEREENKEKNKRYCSVRIGNKETEGRGKKKMRPPAMAETQKRLSPVLNFRREKGKHSWKRFSGKKTAQGSLGWVRGSRFVGRQTTLTTSRKNQTPYPRGSPLKQGCGLEKNQPCGYRSL